LIAESTFRRNSDLHATSVTLFGLRAPLGIFVAGWGGIAMLTAAPFDQWWHAAYGLDVQLVSPPHALLVLGIRLVDLGVLLLAVSALNQGPGPGKGSVPRGQGPENKTAQELSGPWTLHPGAASLQRLVLYLGGLIVAGQMFFMLGYTRDILLHRASPYEAMGLAIPMALALIHIVSRHRWSASLAAAMYTALLLVEIQLLPLFPAHPRLGPVFMPVTHMVPSRFPLLIMAPALALDFLWQRTHTWKLLPLAIVSGIIFTAVLVAVEWPFATLLMTRLAHSNFFGTNYFAFNMRPDRWDRMRVFFFPQTGWKLARGLLLACAYAAASSYIGLFFGRWMKSVQR
jgi:hypothetical protein